MDDKNKDQQLDEVLTRAVEHVYPSLDEVRERLKKGSVTLYLGIDPTGPTLHLGHAINLRKMRCGHSRKVCLRQEGESGPLENLRFQ